MPWFMDREEALRIVRMDQLIVINSTVYEKSPRLLLTVAATEMTLNICLLAFLPVFIVIVWRSGAVHRNFRLQLCAQSLYSSIGITGRFFMFYMQFRQLDDETLILLIPAQFARLAGNVFGETQIAIFALERAIATYSLSWYEKGSRSTILVFILTETFNWSIFILNCYLKYSVLMEYFLASNFLIAITGFLAFWMVYRRNMRLLKEAKEGAQVGNYSVARHFQLKENFEVLRYISWICRGWVVAASSSFVFYSYFTLGPVGYDTSRALSFNIEEISVTLHFVMFYGLSVTGNKHILKQFRDLRIIRALNIPWLKKLSRSAPKIVISSDTDHYFTHFNNSWR